MIPFHLLAPKNTATMTELARIIWQHLHYSQVGRMKRFINYSACLKAIAATTF